jgi:hypothetical protein
MRRLLCSERRYIAANGEMPGWAVEIASLSASKSPNNAAHARPEPSLLTANGDEGTPHLKPKNAGFKLSI